MPLNDRKPGYWFEIARHDRETAVLLLKERGHSDAIIFHLHQTIEKTLKGLLLKNGLEPPLINDLGRLYAMLSRASASFIGVEKVIVVLQAYFIETRFPQGEFLGQNDVDKAKNAFDEICGKLDPEAHP